MCVCMCIYVYTYMYAHVTKTKRLQGAQVAEVAALVLLIEALLGRKIRYNIIHTIR